jgi:hypothetical protein
MGERFRSKLRDKAKTPSRQTPTSDDVLLGMPPPPSLTRFQ